MNFSTNFFFSTHLCLFEWKTSSKYFLWNHRNETYNMELKWYDQLIFNISLNISSSFVIIWIIFRVYLHFVVIDTCINFSQIYSLIIKYQHKMLFLLTIALLEIELPYFEYNLWKHLLILAWSTLKVSQLIEPSPWILFALNV
jgi:hypothetical protein